MRLLRRFLSKGLVSVGLALVMIGLPSPAEEPAGKFYVVEMYDFFFDPPALRLQPGDRVAWIMLQDSLKDGHSATAYHPANDKVLRVPEEAGGWSTPLIKELTGWSEYTFKAIGVHDYFCIPHETEGMVGRVIVKEATGPGADESNSGISAAGKSSLPSIEEIMGPGGLIFNAQAEINAVVFYMRQQSRVEARAALDALRDGLDAGKGTEKSLYETLKSANLLDKFLGGLDQLEEFLEPGHPLSQVTEQAEELKTILDQAYRDVIMSGSGA